MRGRPQPAPLWPTQVDRLRRACVTTSLSAVLLRLPGLDTDTIAALREALENVWNDGQSDGWYRGRDELRENPDAPRKRAR